MNLRSPLGTALGLGSARSGFHHWWAQRLTAAALVVLTPWFVVGLIGLPGFDHAAVSGWLAAPLPAVMMVLLVLALSYHSALGVQVVIEDYVHQRAVRAGMLAAVGLLHVVIAVAGTYSILLVSLGARG